MRIIGGALGGRRIAAARGAGLRPTTDRVRESLFNIAAGIRALGGAKCLDLYAGSGALGIEALSRGAAHSTFVERSRPAALAIRANIAALDLGEAATVVVADAVKFLARSDDRFDLIFADPPYADAGRAALIGVIAGRRVLADGGLFVLEHPARETPLHPALEATRRRAFGETALSFFIWKS